LKRETAKFDVRDVHPSHYGRICPIQTPEGANIGLVLFKSLFSKVNPEGFLETPAIKVSRFVKPVVSELLHRISKESLYELDAKGNATKKLIVDQDEYIGPAQAAAIEKFYGKKGNLIKVKAFVTEDIEYISPELDEKYYIADVTTQLDDYKNIVPVRVAGRHFNEMEMFHVNDITHVDVNPSQIFSANPSMIPFVNHNDTVRAQIGTNQLRQALPLLKSEAPLVGTGFEAEVISDSYAVIKAEDDGEVIYVDGNRIKVKYKSGTKEYLVMVFKKSNQKSAIHQKVRVSLGQKVTKGTILAEGPCVDNGELALGINLRVAYMERDGYNFEDSAIISQRLVKDDSLTSIHIEDYKVEVSDTKLGPEMTTNDIPGVSLNKLKNLDEDGIIRIGSVVKGGDILIGKITPKSE
jgi:DNA-directed RNA polymerase subunit beta